MILTRPFHLTILLLAMGRVLDADEIPCDAQRGCPENPTPGHQTRTFCMTPQLWFEAESASGARGDVVGVTISLHFAPDFDLEVGSISLSVCHDPVVAELVGEPVYSDELLGRNPIMIHFIPVQEDQNPGDTGFGFHSRFSVLRDRSSVAGQLPLMTVYYRLMGTPGESTEISFCDGSLMFGKDPCRLNGISDVRILGFNWPLLSTRNRNGSLTVLEGRPTHPDRPPEPPEAAVYPELPASEDVNLRVRIGRALAVPGDRGIPVDVFVTAGVEYTGVIVPIDFDERYLRVARVEDNFLAGTAIIDNEDAVPGAGADEGYVVVASSIVGKRRIAPAGEEFHAATVYLDVLEAASGIDETTLEVRSVGGRVNDAFIIVRHLAGYGSQQVEARGEFGVVQLSHGVLALRPSAETLAGDANFDGRFDISDPISVLSYLFLSNEEPLLCRPAADYDGDGRLVVTDPINMFAVLFMGHQPPPARDGGLVGCR